jgi:diguanylate cyclase (GGDEF)-like protein/PAS domain S-box-containing protein
VHDQESQDIDVFFRNPRVQKALSDLGLFGIDYVGDRQFSSRLWFEIGYGAGEMSDLTFPDKIHPEDRNEVLARVEDLKAGRIDRWDGMFRFQKKDGDWIWVAVNYAVVSRDDQGRPHLYLGHDQDITEIKQREEELGRRLREIDALRQVTAEVNSSLDLNRTVTAILEHTRRVLPYDRSTVQLLAGDHLQVIGATGFRDPAAPLKLRFPFPGDGNPAIRAIRSRMPVICHDLEGEFPGFLQTEEDEPTRSWLGIPLITDNEVVGLLALDQTQPHFYESRHLEIAEVLAGHLALAMEKARMYEDVRQMALADALTGVANRHSLRFQGPFVLESARRKGTWMSALMVDIDWFKKVNDAFGHQSGDQVLVSVARAIASALRGTDLLFRYGGEEFLVLMAEAGPEEAEIAAERIRVEVERLPDPGTGLTTVSVGGAAAVPLAETSLADLIRAADQALYEAKEAGRNTVRIRKLTL